MKGYIPLGKDSLFLFNIQPKRRLKMIKDIMFIMVLRGV